VNRYDGALCSHFLLDAEPCAPKSYLGHDLNENPAFNIPASGPSVDECFDPSHAAAADLRPMPQSCEESNVDSDAIVTMSQCSEPAAWLDLDQDFRITTFSASNPASPPIKRRSDLHSSSIVDVRPTKRTLKRYLPDKAVIKRSHLTLCTPIGQFDNKIIIVKSKGILIAIDQHAADERVRLENLTEAVHEALETFPQREKSGLLEQTKLVDFVSLLLESTDAFVISAHLTLLHKWGFLCKVTNTRVDRNSCTCTIQAVPTVLSETLTRDDFIEYVAFLKQQESSVEDDVRYPEEGGRISVISIARRLRPPAVTRILASKACRGAIMFGDRLNEEDVLRLVKGLSSCNLPFQCAHGRPSVYPIADIRQLPRTNSEYYNHSVNVGRKLLFDLETRSSNIEEGADGGR
jgi:DNA mismatch repair ATPase MutL